MGHIRPVGSALIIIQSREREA